MDPETQLIYNVIRHLLIKKYERTVVPLKYADCAMYTLDFLEGASNVLILEDLLKLLDEIESVDYLYPLGDPRSLYFDAIPILKDKVFYYNPFRTVVEKYDKESLKKKSQNLKATRKSRTLKITL